MEAPITGYPGYRVNTEGQIFGPRGKALVPQLTNGYERVFLYNEQGRRRVRVHVVVLETFRERRPPGMEAAHLDGNRRNNHLDNLQWKTAQENTDDKRKHGTIPRDDFHPRTKVPKSRVPVIIEMIFQGTPAKEIAREHGITTRHVRRIATGTRRAIR